MKRGKLKILIFLLCFISLSCTPAPIIKGFRSERWIGDRNGCKGTRLTTVKALLEAKSQLIGLSEETIIRILGRPDQCDLFNRNQKFDIYFLEPGPNCGKNAIKNPEMLIIRIDALGKCSEVFSEKGFTAR